MVTGRRFSNRSSLSSYLSTIVKFDCTIFLLPVLFYHTDFIELLTVKLLIAVIFYIFGVGTFLFQDVAILKFVKIPLNNSIFLRMNRKILSNNRRCFLKGVPKKRFNISRSKFQFLNLDGLETNSMSWISFNIGISKIF